MTYITGDTHRDFYRIEQFCQRVQPPKEDTMIILGDAGINYFGDQRDQALKELLAELPITLLCIHGNHEMRPQRVPSYLEMQWNSGTVFIEQEYPNLIFAKDGEVYDIEGQSCLVTGGAYSVDKFYRLICFQGWWKDEQPSQEVKQTVEAKIELIGHQVDGDIVP